VQVVVENTSQVTMRVLGVSFTRRTARQPRHRGVQVVVENTSQVTMRVLGVFHPADSPAAKA